MTLLPDLEAASMRRTRHSRFVAFMRRFLPVLALVLLALLVAWPQMQANIERVQVGYSGESLKSLGRNALALMNARYYGLDKDLNPFSVLAESARQNEAEIIMLEQPRADMLTADGSGVLLDARHGVYRQKEQVLRLDGGVSVYHDAGYEIHTEAVTVDLADGSATGTDPVAGHGPQIQLEGEGLMMTERGRTIFLTGKSHVTLFPRKEAQQ